MKFYEQIERPDIYGRKNGNIVNKILYLQNIGNQKGKAEETASIAQTAAKNLTALDKIVKEKYNIFSDIKPLTVGTSTGKGVYKGKNRYGFN